MINDGDSHPNLRNRKHPDVSPRIHREKGSDENEMKPLLSTSSESSSPNTSDTNGYVLIPLRERSVLSRLDFGPFLFCYGILIAMDITREEDKGDIVTSSFSLVAFPLVLFAHFGLFLVQQWSVSWRATVGYRRLDTKQTWSSMTSSKTLLAWTHCLVEAPNVDKHQSSHDAGIVPVQHRIRRTDKDIQVLAVVNFQDVVFRCNVVDDVDADTSLWSNGNSVSTARTTAKSPVGLFHKLKYPIHLPLSFYENWRGHKSMELVRKAQQTYGSNTTPIDLPPFIDLLQEQVVAPFFLFQILCVLLWSLDEYWYYAMFTFFALLMFESTVAYNRLKSLERLRSYTVHSQRQIWVHRPTYPLGRNGWVQILVAELVPGDIVSCKQITLRSSSHYNGTLAQKQHQLNQIPADILILNGDAVVDESQITGESVPQLKVALEGGSGSCSAASASNTNEETLDLQDHKQFILFGGTTLLVSHAGATPLSTVSEAPDQGAIGIVLRTGFETAQGSLLRTMAHTQKSVDGIHTRDTYVFILVLLCMAVASAFMVWEEGSKDPLRNKFRLSLHVVIIITSVVPPELPMELSLAVTNSVADLIRRRIFCTESFRIPLAGQVNVCCFDKTGTLTSDEMQLKGLRLMSESKDDHGNETEGSFTDVLEPNATLPWPALRIMAACHSLAVNVHFSSRGSEVAETNSLIGDPLEKAVLENTGYKMINNSALRKTDASLEGRPDSILILQRFGFSSKLKRMSVLTRESASGDTWVLTKGAPETIKTFLRSENTPDNYDDIYMHHMAMGQRVLAMAYRKLSKEEANQPVREISRETVESNLIFAGFVLLHCPIKTDSNSVISELWSSGNKVVMITGDAILTAAEVARQVGIIRKAKKLYPSTLELKCIPGGDKNGTAKNGFRNEFQFVPLSNKAQVGNDENLTLATANVNKLRKMVMDREIALCVSGDVLQKLVVAIVQPSRCKSELHGPVTDEKQLLLHPAAQDILKDLVPLCAVFARCNPRQKEAIVAAFNLGGFTTLMCGDGTNDVGALRRAHVGISIISAPEIEAKQRSATKAMLKMKSDQKKERKVKGTKKGSRARNASSLEKSLRQLQEAQDELDQIELGDASIASPFTSRMVSIKCCKVVLQQGRCTLVTMLQIYKILGVNCLVNAMILSKLFLHGVKQGDRQLTILGLFVAGLFFFVTRGKPLPNLSAKHPPTSVLCTQALVSIAVQFAIHYASMIIATEVALSFVDPFDPSMIPDGPFNPNTLNTCTFLISVLATVNTFAVNYRGEPFVEPLRENKMLWRSLQVCYATLIVCALEIFPPLNDLMQLAEFPDTVNTGTLEWMKDFTSSSQLSTPLVSMLTQLVQHIGFKAFMICLMACDTFLVFTSERIILKALEE